MISLVRAELLKALTTRGWVVLVVGAVAFALANLTITALVAGWDIPVQEPPPGLATATGQRGLFAAVAAGGVFAILLGALGASSEHRHHTLTTTLLAAPRRDRVLCAKLLGYFLLAAGLGLVVWIICVPAAELALSLRAAPVWPLPSDAWSILGEAALGYGLYGMLGVGIGTLVRNQVAAALVVLIWTQVVESAVLAFLPAVGRWTLTGAGASLVRYGETTGLSLLPAWVGAGVLLGYGLAIGLLALLVTSREDVT